MNKILLTAAIALAPMLAFGQAPPIRFDDRPLTYKQAWEAAKDLKKPLVVFLNVQSRPVPGCVVTGSLYGLSDGSTNAIVVSVDGTSRIDLPTTASNTDILDAISRKVVRQPAATFRPVLSFQQADQNCIGGT